MECNITDEELEKRYNTVNISHEPMYYPFSEGQKAERVVVDLVHDNSSVYYVHIEFSPVGVFYTGDMGSFTFNGRLISQPKYFFSGSHINPHYWKEKVCAAEQGYYRKEISEDKLNSVFKEEAMEYKLSDYTDESVEEAKEALRMDEDDFKEWCIKVNKEDGWGDEDTPFSKIKEYGSDYIRDVIALRNMSKPTDYMERNTEESAYDAVSNAMDDLDIDDFELAGDIVDRAVEEDYLFLYACKVLQWVSNKIRKQEQTTNP